MALKPVEGKHEDSSDLFFWDDVLKDEGPESIFDFPLEEKEEKETEEAQHARNKCMSCDDPPTTDVLWAEGIGHAWFCDGCYTAWEKEHPGEVNNTKKIEHGIARMKFSDRNSPKSLREEEKKGLGRGWWGPPKGTHGKAEMLGFSNKEEATEWLSSEQSINPKLTADENDAMQYYKTDGYYDINSDLRDAGYSEDDRVDIIESVIDGTSLSRSIVAYRGADWDVFDEEDLTGSEIEDGTLVSTSLIETVAAAQAGGVSRGMRVSKGARAINMERWQVGGWAEGEAELLLQRNATFKVISDDFGTDPDTRRMVLELVLP